jgi:hypothetical protein
VRTSQATHRQGEGKTWTFPQATHRQGEGILSTVYREKYIPSGGQYSRVRANQDSSQATHRQGANSLQLLSELPGKGESEGVDFFFGWLDNIQIC